MQNDEWFTHMVSGVGHAPKNFYTILRSSVMINGFVLNWQIYKFEMKNINTNVQILQGWNSSMINIKAVMADDMSTLSQGPQYYKTWKEQWKNFDAKADNAQNSWISSFPPSFYNANLPMLNPDKNMIQRRQFNLLAPEYLLFK